MTNSFFKDPEWATWQQALLAPTPSRAAGLLSDFYLNGRHSRPLATALLHRALATAFNSRLAGIEPALTVGAYALLAGNHEALATAIATADLLAPAMVNRWAANPGHDPVNIAEDALSQGAFAFATLNGNVTLLKPAHRFAALIPGGNGVLKAGLREGALALRRAVECCGDPANARLRLTLEKTGIVAVLVWPKPECATPIVHFHNSRPPATPTAQTTQPATLYAAQLIHSVLRA